MIRLCNAIAMRENINELHDKANLLKGPLTNLRYPGPPRAVGGPGTKQRNEAPCERSEQKILLITPSRLNENAFQSIS